MHLFNRGGKLIQMSRYIEFTTSRKNRHTDFSMRSPVHDGHLPTRFRSTKGVRVNKQPIAFADETLPDRLHQTLIEGKALHRKALVFDCVVFVALINSVELGQPKEDGLFKIDQRVKPMSVDTSDATNDLPLMLGHTYNQAPHYVHAAQPAHVTDGGGFLREGAFYLHKLGDEGPVCLSGLDKAMIIYGCNIAHPATEMWCD